MNFLDMRSIIFSYILINIVSTVVVVLLWRQTRNRIKGTFLWVIDFVFQTTALTLIALRGFIPDWISIVISNVLSMTGIMLGYMALLYYFNKNSKILFNCVLIIAFTVVQCWFTFSRPSLAVRNLNISITGLFFFVQCAWLMLCRINRKSGKSTLLLGIVFVAYSFIDLARIVEFFVTNPMVNDFYKSGAFYKVVLLLYQLFFILLTYGLVLMFNKQFLDDIALQEEKFSRAFYSSPYAITITNLQESRVIEMNEGFLKISGYQASEVKGKTTIDLQLWNKDEDRIWVVDEMRNKGKIYEKEFQFKKKSGELITGLFSAEIIKINDENCVLSSINDITARKQAENALFQKMNELAHFNEIMIERELKMIELKREINALLKELGKSPKYKMI